MAITDLFSHKIHASGDEWPEKLSELAFIFSEFDGEIYQRDLIERRLSGISPRTAYAASYARDISKFRDEISAYPAYLGLYHLEPSTKGWRLRLTETAKKFLITEEPDACSFLRLQLTLFQYPNAMGAVYRSGSNNLWMQANARDRTLELIKQGMHLSPLRLIVLALRADAELRNVDLLQGQITFREIYGLSNDTTVNGIALPSIDRVRDSLKKLRAGKSKAPIKYERRFHILKHVELFEIGHGKVTLRNIFSGDDAADLLQKLGVISQIDSQFNGFDTATSGKELANVVGSGMWGRYFDALRTLKSSDISILSSGVEPSAPPAEPKADIMSIPEVYPLQERSKVMPVSKQPNRKHEFADPELTRIKKQRRNLVHKELVGAMDQLLRSAGAKPKENPHIDLYAEIPGDGAYIFEMKSGGANLLEQIRKGLSQLYEYRFRYREHLSADVVLCLVIPKEPVALPWLKNYLCDDRGIGLCWFNEKGKLSYPKSCSAALSELSERLSEY